MTREELEEVFTNALKEKLIGTKHSNGKKIKDVRIELKTHTEYGEDEYSEWDYETITIKVKTEKNQFKWSELFY